ncbi:glycosyltransferase family 4 protein [candidate division KSB1 bacterium]|nr:glycosyltransferase family 4 protein [candidate division KSB1 bacterium]
MKTIAINGIVLTPQSGGILVYVQNLIDQFLAMNPDWDFKIFFSENFLSQYSQYQNLNQVIGLPVTGDSPFKRIFYETYAWPKLIKKYKVSLFHSPISYIPLRMPIPSVVTIHDLRSFHEPEYYNWLRGNYLSYMIRQCAKKVQKIIAISDYTKNDIIETLEVPAEKVVRIYEGFDPERFQIQYTAEQKAQIRNKYHLPEQYILSVGHLEPRKNFIRLIAAYHQLRQEQHIPHKLIIVGRENWLFKSFYEKIRELKLENLVHFIGFVAHEDLPAVYQMADVFVLPTLFEGFGFPPLESMAAGTAVACSNVTSLPEICGDAALFFDPLNVQQIAERIFNLINNNEIKESFVQKGFQNILRFSWQECARETANIYKNIPG